MTEQMNAPSTLRLNDDLQKLGFDNDSIDVLAKVLTNWRHGGKHMSRNRFKNENRAKRDSIEWLRNSEFIKEQSGDIYEPQFAAFAVLVAAKKRAATALLRPMEFTLVQVKRSIRENPDCTSIPFKKFACGFEQEGNLIDALRLISSGPFRIHFNGFSDLQTATVGFTDDVFKTAALREEISKYLTTMVGNRRRGSFAPFGQNFLELSTFSLASLELVPDAFEQAKTAIEKTRSEPAAAITSAAACLEAVLKWIAHHEGLSYSAGAKLRELLDICRDAVALGSNSTHSLAKTIATLCHQIPEARNALSNAHGKGPGAVPATRQEARFIVGTCVHLAECLLDRWEGQRQARAAN